MTEHLSTPMTLLPASASWAMTSAYSVDAMNYGLVGDDFTDNAPMLTDLYNDLEARRLAGLPMPRLRFPSGIFRTSDFPNFAFSWLQMVAEGECRIRYTGTGDAFHFDGMRIDPAGIRNVLIDGFIFETPAGAKNGLILTGIHNSVVKTHAQGCGSQHYAIEMRFCVCTEIQPTVSTNDGWPWGGWVGARGLHLTHTAGPRRTTKCSIINPVLEGLQYGCVIDYADINSIRDGTMEGCVYGLVVAADLASAPHGNVIYDVDYEYNSIYDVVMQAGSHNRAINCLPITPSAVITGGVGNAVRWHA